MRTFDAELVNRIANSPGVRDSFPWFVGEIDFSAEVADHDSYVFLVEGGCAGLFEWSAPGVWQVHTMAASGSRGRHALQAGRAMIRWMLDQKATMLWGLTPEGNRAARLFNRLIGARSAGMRDHHVTGPGELFVWRPSW